MAKVLIIAPLNASYALYSVRSLLDTLGIDHETLLAITSANYGAGLGAIPGLSASINPSDAATRTFLQRYNAVLLFPHQEATSSSNVFDPTLNTWMLNWNGADDPPVFHFGQPITTARTGLLPTPPSDFPIIKGDTASPDTTMWRWGIGAFTTVSRQKNLMGGRVRLVREGVSVYTRALNFFWSTECAAYLIDTTKPGEGSAWERLIVPDFPDQARLTVWPANTAPVFGLRYRNHYFLPSLNTVTNTAPLSARVSGHSAYASALLWVLYALKLAGIQPSRRIPLVLEFDHFVQGGMEPVVTAFYGRTYTGQLTVTRNMLRWLRDFCKARGAQVVYTNHSSGKHNPSAAPDSLWSYITLGGPAPPDEREAVKALAREIRDLLVQNPDVFLCGIHDHTALGGGFNATRWAANQTLTRHDDAGYPFAAPQPVPTKHGTVFNAKVAPASYRNDPNSWQLEVGGESLIDYNPPTATAQTYQAQDGNYWTAQVLIERNIADHVALGIDWKGGAVGYTNQAGNLHGGIGFWEVFRSRGWRGLRVDLSERRHGYPSGDPRDLRYAGIQFVPTCALDLCQSGAGFYRHASQNYSNTAFGRWAIENGTELRGANNEWLTDLAWRQEKGVVAIRRFLAAAVDVWLWTACVLRGTGYAHPLEATWVDANDPVDAEPFSGAAGNQVWAGAANYSRFHFIVQLVQAMDTVIGLLSDYLKWGKIDELMAMRG